MGTISVSLPSDGQTADAADYNTPVTTIVNAINGGLDNANIASGAAIATSKLADDAGVTTAKIANDAVTDAKLVYGKVRSRQGGSATNWSTVGTTTYDYSATNTFIQCGTILSNASPKTITFPTAFTQIPLVIGTVSSTAAANCFVKIGTVTTTTVQIQVITADNTASTAENVNWLAIGE